MKKKYYESVYGKQHERVAPKKAEKVAKKAQKDQVITIGDWADMPSLNGSTFYKLGKTSRVSQEDFIMNAMSSDKYVSLWKQIEKNKEEARLAWEKKCEYYKSKEEIELRKSIEDDISRVSIDTLMKIIDSYGWEDSITVSTVDQLWHYTVGKRYLVNLIDKIQLEKAEQERELIVQELAKHKVTTRETTTRTGGRL